MRVWPRKSAQRGTRLRYAICVCRAMPRRGNSKCGTRPCRDLCRRRIIIINIINIIDSRSSSKWLPREAALWPGDRLCLQTRHHPGADWGNSSMRLKCCKRGGRCCWTQRRGFLQSRIASSKSNAVANSDFTRQPGMREIARTTRKRKRGIGAAVAAAAAAAAAAAQLDPSQTVWFRTPLSPGTPRSRVSKPRTCGSRLWTRIYGVA